MAGDEFVRGIPAGKLIPAGSLPYTPLTATAPGVRSSSLNKETPSCAGPG